MTIYNTLGRKVEEFEAIHPPRVGMYSCGPTVYDYAHIGHIRRYVTDDILIRLLKSLSYNVKHVMNVTDVGHLSSDADAGEDKLERGAKKWGKTVLEVAREFEDDFWRAMSAVNIQKPDVVSRATEHIEDQIALIEELAKKGYTYQTDQAVYFDVSKFAYYAKLSGQKLGEKQVGVREEVYVDKQKKHPADFALWFFTVGRFSDHVLRWPSPFGEGFPGWHIECSAMSMKYLGFSFDIHTGGIDHIPIHHTNEIAQSEAVTDEPLAKYWVHSAFLKVDDAKMSKSQGNIYRIHDLVEKGYNPLAFRLLTYQTHYRTEMNFTWKALDSAQTTLDNLYALAAEFKSVHAYEDVDYWRQFQDAVGQDLNMPKALSIMWQMLRAKLEDDVKASTLFKMDEILGLKIQENSQKAMQIPTSVIKMVEDREALRREKKYTQSDHLRQRIEKMGYIIEDRGQGTKILKKT